MLSFFFFFFETCTDSELMLMCNKLENNPPFVLLLYVIL
jgi:hypothetical protein